MPPVPPVRFPPRPLQLRPIPSAAAVVAAAAVRDRVVGRVTPADGRDMPRARRPAATFAVVELTAAPPPPTSAPPRLPCLLPALVSPRPARRRRPGAYHSQRTRRAAPPRPRPSPAPDSTQLNSTARVPHCYYYYSISSLARYTTYPFPRSHSTLGTRTERGRAHPAPHALRAGVAM